MTPRALADTAGIREALVRGREATLTLESSRHPLCMVTTVVLSMVSTSALDRQATLLSGDSGRDTDACMWLHGEPLGLPVQGPGADRVVWSHRVRRQVSRHQRKQGSRKGGDQTVRKVWAQRGTDTGTSVRPLGSQMGFMHWRGPWSPE